jgi:hypothetical protein
MIDSLVPGPARLALAAAVAAACCAAAASAQTTTPKLTVTPQAFGRTECVNGTDVTISWTFTALSTSETIDAFLTTDQTCPVSGSTPLNPPQLAAGNVTVKAAALLLGQKNGCDSDVKSSAPGKTHVCVRRLLSGTVEESLNATVTYALTAPTAPAQPVARAGDQHVKLSWSQGDPSESIGSYDVFAKAAAGTPADALVPADETDAGPQAVVPGDQVFVEDDRDQSKVASTNADVDALPHGQPLLNGVKYAFAVRAVDTFGNLSALSAVQVARPLTVEDFYRHYRSNGGQDTGGHGCGTLGSAGWLVAIGCLLLLLRRRKGSGAALALLLAMAAGSARAEETLDERLARVSRRPPRKLLFALKIDRYDPQIDSAAGLTGKPYHDIFHGRAPLRWQIEADWQVAHPFGSILIGVTAGYWQNIGKGWDPQNNKPSEDTALLDILPFGLIATYRFDWAADRLNIPVIPYAQFGLQAALWASFNGRGDVVSTSGGRGSGWTTGTTQALGVALALDWLDPGLSREAYNDVGIQRASLFAEYGWTHLTSFGKASSLVLSDRAWRFGLALEF